MARIAFRPLWTVTVQHSFFGGSCDALSFIVPPATERALAGVHALLRVLDGALHVLVEVDGGNAPLSNTRSRACAPAKARSVAGGRVKLSASQLPPKKPCRTVTVQSDRNNASRQMKWPASRSARSGPSRCSTAFLAAAVTR